MSQSIQLHQLPLNQLKGLGPAMREKLAKLGIYKLQDLLFHLPLRFEDRTRISSLSSLQPNSTALVEGQVLSAHVQQGRRRSLLVRLSDSSGAVGLRFYHFSNALKNKFVAGTRLRCYGEFRPGATGLEIYHPELTFLDEVPNQPANTPNNRQLTQQLTPVYPSTQGVNQRQLRGFIEQALQLLASFPIEELLPADFLAQQQLPSLQEALWLAHLPPIGTDLSSLENATHPAIQRLVIEELLAQQLGLMQLRQANQEQQALPLRPQAELTAQFLASLSFSPTQAQSRVTQEILTDLAQPKPMLRLVQGDVGSGKTLVAALACLAAISSGQQAALLAPTELLAEQHLANLQGWLSPLGIQVAGLTGRTTARVRKELLPQLAAGEIQLLVGTHAIFQAEVNYHSLALIVIDEQHRFGVGQRLELRNKGANCGYLPHQLVMTATPIPRTLAMSAYADLDLSVIDELPPGRTPVTTLVMPTTRREEVMQRLAAALAEGRQAYWVCTLIEESETLEVEAAENTATELSEALPHIKIGLVHGKLKPAEKAELMNAFKAGELQLLVATTVIEVGVDVPNASLMLIDNAERLGLAQLHQLRGRVGRGSTASYCILLYKPPLSLQGKQRLEIMRSTNDGFVIAEKDLELRGPGEVLGTKQTGAVELRLAKLERDGYLLDLIQPLAKHLLENNPQQTASLLARWHTKGLDLAQV